RGHKYIRCPGRRGLLHPAGQALASDDGKRPADESEVEGGEPDWFLRERARAGAHGFIEAFLQKRLDRLLVALRNGPVQQVVRTDVGPALEPRALVGDERDPDIGAEPEVMAALGAHIVVRSKLVKRERDAAAGAVGRQQDLGQRTALDRHFVARHLGDHRLRPPSTAITWPVMKPARSEQRKATAEAHSSAVPSRLIGVSLTSSPTISSVREPLVSSVRT